MPKPTVRKENLGGEIMKKEAKEKNGGGETPQESDHYLRYPEEEFIDEQEADEDEPGHAGAELAEHFGSVTGKPGGTTSRKE